MTAERLVFVARRRLGRGCSHSIGRHSYSGSRPDSAPRLPRDSAAESSLNSQASVRDREHLELRRGPDFRGRIGDLYRKESTRCASQFVIAAGYC